jgi:hypothetical protein
MLKQVDCHTSIALVVVEKRKQTPKLFELYIYNSEADHPVLCRIWCTSLAVFCDKVHLAQGWGSHSKKLL